MRCTTNHRWLSEYLDGELSARDARTLEGHLADCAGCAAELAAMRRVVRLFQAQAEEEPPAALHARIMGAISGVPAATPARPASWWTRLAGVPRRLSPAPAWGLAAAGAALVVGLYWPRLTPPRAPEPGKTLDSPGIATTPSHVLPPVLPPETDPSLNRGAQIQARKPTTLAAPSPHISPSTTAGPAVAHPTAQPEGASPRLGRPAASASVRVARADTPTLPEERKVGRSRRPAAAGNPASRTTGRARPTGRSTRTPRMSRETSAPTPDAAVAANDVAPPPMPADETMTMMASMPAMPGDIASESTSPDDDDLASLRRRLADERRELPRVHVDPGKPATPRLPVHIEF